MRALSLDIETECDVEDCTESDCKHALDHHRSRITVVGIYFEMAGVVHREVYRDLGRLRIRLDGLCDFTLVGHNLLQFDLKHLKAKGLDLTDRPWECTQLMAVAYSRKIPDKWLARYEARRKEINKTLPHGHKAHREAGKHSLKTLAPHFLGVQPFWEETGDKDNDDYVLTDCAHTYRLFQFLRQALVEDDTDKFYREKLKPWCQMLFEGEWEGIGLDYGTMTKKEMAAQDQARSSKRKLDQYWESAYGAYEAEQMDALTREYEEKKDIAIAKLKDPSYEKRQKTIRRYAALWGSAAAKIEPFNLDSPAQMAWLLRDHLGYDITNFEGEDSTGVEVLERLAAEGKDDIKALLDYREASKLITSFFPKYRELAWKGKIHASFKLAIARTGRSTSSDPNLQQVPGHIRPIFIPPPGHSLIIKDFSGAEPALIGYLTKDPMICGPLIEHRNFHDGVVPLFFDMDCDEKEIKKLYPKERDATKEADLSLFYGAAAGRLRISAMKRGFPWTMRDAKDRVERFRAHFETAFQVKREVIDPTAEAGHPLINLFGRKIRIEQQDVYMKAFNTLVQSSASDMLFRSCQKMRDEFKARSIRAKILLWVHDEVVVEVDDRDLIDAEEIIDRCMTSYKLPTPYGNLPLKVEGHVSKYWKK
jgi:DNA polymerase I-like protein with 3'-5' exonuclease and polymerase domains